MPNATSSSPASAPAGSPPSARTGRTQHRSGTCGARGALAVLDHAQPALDGPATRPAIGIVVDAGHDYLELRGVEITGTVEVVAEVPRTGEPHAELAPIEAEFASKYFGTEELFLDGRHAWLRVTPAKISSWDFRKLADL